jgi:hypothetical protein
MMIGLIFTGIGGFGVYYFGQASQNQRELSRAAKETDFNAKVSALQKTNEELRQRLELFELAAPTGTLTIVKPKNEAGKALQTPEKKEGSPGLAARPTPARVNAPPLAKGGANAGTSDWSGETPTLEQLALAAQSTQSPKQSARLNDKQLEDMAKILRKHSGKTIAIHSVAGDAGGLQFAETLRRAFLDAGWHVGSINQVAYTKAPVGLYVSTEMFPSPDEAVATYQALTAAGLNVSQQLDSKLNGEKAVLLIGATAK